MMKTFHNIVTFMYFIFHFSIFSWLWYYMHQIEWNWHFCIQKVMMSIVIFFSILGDYGSVYAWWEGPHPASAGWGVRWGWTREIVMGFRRLVGCSMASLAIAMDRRLPTLKGHTRSRPGAGWEKKSCTPFEVGFASIVLLYYGFSCQTGHPYVKNRYIKNNKTKTGWFMMVESYRSSFYIVSWYREIWASTVSANKKELQ